MEKHYMVVRNGQSKKTGDDYSVALRMCGKKDGSSSWLDEKDNFFTDDIRSLGTIITVEQTEI